MPFTRQSISSRLCSVTPSVSFASDAYCTREGTHESGPRHHVDGPCAERCWQHACIGLRRARSSGVSQTGARKAFTVRRIAATLTRCAPPPVVHSLLMPVFSPCERARCSAPFMRRVSNLPRKRERQTATRTCELALKGRRHALTGENAAAVHRRRCTSAAVQRATSSADAPDGTAITLRHTPNEVKRPAKLAAVKREVRVAHAGLAVAFPAEQESFYVPNALELGCPVSLLGPRPWPTSHNRVHKVVIWSEKHELRERAAHVDTKEAADIENVSQQSLTPTPQQPQ